MNETAGVHITQNTKLKYNYQINIIEIFKTRLVD